MFPTPEWLRPLVEPTPLSPALAMALDRMADEWNAAVERARTFEDEYPNFWK
jgi:hypothetical protein